MILQSGLHLIRRLFRFRWDSAVCRPIVKIRVVASSRTEVSGLHRMLLDGSAQTNESFLSSDVGWEIESHQSLQRTEFLINNNRTVGVWQTDVPDLES